MITNRRNWQSYLMWQILMILFSLVPMGLYLAEPVWRAVVDTML